MNLRAVALGLALLASVAAAQSLAPAARAEIDTLLTRLQSSGCQFNRNGTWYGASDARTHLLKKLEYLERRNLVRSTEQFIELAASTSSASGKAYLVRCPGASALESRAWLGTELERLRSAAK